MCVQMDDEEATPVVEHHLAGDLHLGGRHSGVGLGAAHLAQGMERPSASGADPAVTISSCALFSVGVQFFCSLEIVLSDRTHRTPG